MMAWPPSGVLTLSVLAMATPPWLSISLATRSAGPASPPSPLTLPPRSLTTSCAPREASRRACSRPSPPPAPVMTATLPSKPRSAMAPERSVSPRCRKADAERPGRSAASGDGVVPQAGVVDLAAGRAPDRLDGEHVLGRLVGRQSVLDVGDDLGLLQQGSG